MEASGLCTEASPVASGKRSAAISLAAGGKGGPAGERDRLAVCLRALASLLRDLGILVEAADAKTLANPDVRPRLDALARAFDSRRSTSAYAAVDQALGALERNASPKVVADWLVLQL